MQQYHPDASGYIKSLDKIYFFTGQRAHQEVALEAHRPRTSDEMELLVGDRITRTKLRLWDNGYSKGINERTSANGLYPLYKVEEVVRIAKMPTYPDADQNNQTNHENR